MTTRLLHISDVHFGVEDRSALDVVAQAIADDAPDAVVCTGDLTQRATHRQYAEAADWFNSLGVPVILQAGNHDMPYYNLWERFTDPYQRFRRLDAAAGSVLQSDDVVLVPLVTTVRAQPRFPWSDGFVRTPPLQRTVRALEALKGDPRTKIVMCHHPLLAPKDAQKNPTIGGDQGFAAIAAAGADAVISGHVHTPFDEVRERGGHSLRMIGVGTLSTRLRHGMPPCYQTLTCKRGGRITVDLHIIGSEVAEPMATMT